MASFEHSVVVDADREALFALTQDYSRRLEWDPFLSEARLCNADAPGVGVRAWCVDHRGRGMETEYVSFRPPDRVAVRMTRGPWVIKSFAGAWIFEEVAPGRTRVRFRYHLETRVPLLDRLLRPMFAKETARRLEGLERAVKRDAGAAAKAD
jgi:ribosome-associated toxin RatA of RatAB toxin-antitoxin module